MVLFSKDKLQSAHKLLQEFGFVVQHQRILKLSSVKNGEEYQCMLGFEAEGDDKYEANFSFLKRRAQGSQKDAVHASSIQVISFDDIPEELKEKIEQAKSSLATL